jgi:LAO/AO transport system kinase
VADEVEQIIDGCTGGDRRALARAITLVESSRPDHRRDADRLVQTLLPRTGRSTRVGVSGPPGAGKSTFIEALGTQLADGGRSVAVLAVDPSSVRSGGSILGDKTRMAALARNPRAFIRPSPSAGALGGVARRTREAMLVCEAAGFEVVIVETVGVGQSEVEVDDMVDTFVLLLAPGAGDELQGVKRGIVELADVVVVTKADGELLPAARRAAADYRQALHLLRPKHPGWVPPVLLASALDNDGVAEVWAAVEDHRRMLDAGGRLGARRAQQATSWFWHEVNDRLLTELRADPRVSELAGELEGDVAHGSISPGAAAARLLEARSTGD